MTERANRIGFEEEEYPKIHVYRKTGPESPSMPKMRQFLVNLARFLRLRAQAQR